MAISKQFSGYNQRSKFLIGKVSNFSPKTNPEVPYYQRIRHTKSKKPFSNRYYFSFDTQIIPYVLPGEVISISPIQSETFRLLSEINQSMITELGDYIILDS